MKADDSYVLPLDATFGGNRTERLAMWFLYILSIWNSIFLCNKRYILHIKFNDLRPSQGPWRLRLPHHSIIRKIQDRQSTTKLGKDHLTLRAALESSFLAIPSALLPQP